jgi:putative membrane protein
MSRTPWLGLFLALYAAARVLQMFPGRVPMVLIVALHVLPAFGFALVHGAMVYRRRGILIFVLLCIAIGNALENLSISTGFPFGRYRFTDAMGPKIFAVPILLGLAYIGMAYISWTVARLILGDAGAALTGARRFTRPLVAAFVMTAWDLTMDPVWANLVGAWRWHRGGAYFGVPASNFLGWYLTVYLIYQAFALWAGRQPAAAKLLSVRFWQTAVLFYGVSALGNLFVLAPSRLTTVTDASGAVWRVRDIQEVSALVSIFVMGAFALIAWLNSESQSGSRSG